MFDERWYQAEAVQSVFDYFEHKNGNPLIAMPTGTGKSIVIAQLIRRIFFNYPGQRILLLTHSKNLVEQNAEKLLTVWPNAPLGIHSEGLRARETQLPIIFGTVKSAANTIEAALNNAVDFRPYNFKHFGHRDLLFIDEAHLVSPEEDTQYQFIIAELKRINPKLKIIGLTATPYRTKQGSLIEEGIFTDICYDITGIEAFNRLIYEGFMSPIVARPTQAYIDTSEVSIIGGEFNQKQLAKVTALDEVTYACVKETLQYAENRCSWLFFAANIDHAETINAMLQSFGVNSACAHSKLKASDENIRAYKNYDLLALVTMNKLTTGFDKPGIDLISDMQPTNSVPKHVQKYGRGTRPCEYTQKRDCLGLDFGRNVPRLGPINDPKIPNARKKGSPGTAPIRICDNCGMYNHSSARFCGGGKSKEEAISYGGCGNAFLFETKLFQNAGIEEFIKTDTTAIVEYFNVSRVIYNLHEKKDNAGILTSPPSIKVSYFCGLKMFSEWICLEHPGIAGRNAREWWKQRHSDTPPFTTAEALKIVSQLRMPAKIRVRIDLKYPQILSHEF